MFNLQRLLVVVCTMSAGALLRPVVQGEVDGVVRMPMLKGFYLLEKIDDKRTRVTYQAQADVGGRFATSAPRSGAVPSSASSSWRARTKRRIDEAAVRPTHSSTERAPRPNGRCNSTRSPESAAINAMATPMIDPV